MCNIYMLSQKHRLAEHLALENLKYDHIPRPITKKRMKNVQNCEYDSYDHKLIRM